jgi:hypothetical protein
MFGCSGGESAETVARKRRYMVEARERWPFITLFDASTIKSEAQLVSLVKDRTSVSRPDAERDVQSWTRNRQFDV